jgi:superfamily II DNA or RNA helicase
MTHPLRPYQSAAIQGIYNYFQEDTGNSLVVIPTAGGKSLVMGTFVEGVPKAFPDQRILIVTHVRELIEQNYEELKRLWPQAPADIYSAGLKKREITTYHSTTAFGNPGPCKWPYWVPQFRSHPTRNSTDCLYLTKLLKNSFRQESFH